MTNVEKRREVKCPFCTQMVGTHPSGVLLPHKTGRDRGSECFGSRRKP